MTKYQSKFTYDEFIEEMDDVCMGIGDIADRLEITIEEVESWKNLKYVPKKAVDLLAFEQENAIIDE